MNTLTAHTVTSGNASPPEPYEASRLRWATLKDTDKLVQLYNAARPASSETPVGMLDWLEHGGGLVLENTAGDILCALRWHENQDGWQVDRIATLPDARGQGYGRWLMTKLEALAIRRNIASLTLTLDEVNNELTRYYQRMGYRVTTETSSSVILDKKVGGVWQFKA